MKRVYLLVLVICIAYFSTGCGLFFKNKDLGLKHLEEKYPDYTFTYSGSHDGKASCIVDGFDDRVVVRVYQEDPLVLYDNFLYVRYRDQILESQVNIMEDICSRLGVNDFNIATYGYEGWMRDGELTSNPLMSNQNALDCNTEYLSFDDFMASPDSNNEFIGVVYIQDVANVDREAVAEIISDVIEDSGCVFSLVRVDFTDDYEEFESTYNRRWTVYNYQLMLWGETDGEGQLINYTWTEH